MPLRRVFQNIFIAAAFLLAYSGASAQVSYTISTRNGVSRIRESQLSDDIEFLSGERCAGRKTGTQGNFVAAAMISSRFSSLGMKPFGESFTLTFETSEGSSGRNIAGFFPGSGDGYVIVGASFDGLGVFDGTLYPGADCNASGVAAMLAIGEAIHYMNSLGRTFSRNIILVAFDARQLNLAGSGAFMKALADGRLVNPVSGKTVLPRDVSLMVNLDQLGSVTVPFGSRPDYLIMLSAGTDGSSRSALLSANREDGTGLDIAFDYYGSKDFTRLFFTRICDQRAFLESGIRSVMFTSGITLNNNKSTDTLSTIDIPTLRKRVVLIYYWLSRYI